MKTEFLDVTPEVAQSLLSKNTNNRRVSKTKLAQYIDAMQRGQWRFNGDTIRISDTDRLLDGQHRLMAIATTGITQPMLLITGLQDQSFTTIDIGKTRSAADCISLIGVNNPVAIAALARKIIIWNKDRSQVLRNSKKVGGGSSSYGFVAPSNDDILDFVDANDLSEYVQKGSLFSSKFSGLTAGEYSFLYYIFANKNQDDAEEFFRLFTTGLASSPRNPVLYVRNKIIDGMSSNMQFTGRVKFITIVKAWNHLRKHEERKVIRVAMDEEIPELV